MLPIRPFTSHKLLFGPGGYAFTLELTGEDLLQPLEEVRDFFISETGDNHPSIQFYRANKRFT